MPLFNGDTNLIYPPHPGFASGRYYSSSIIQATTQLTCYSSYVYYTYFFVPFRQAFSKIAFQITTTIATNIGFAIYEVTNGLPSNLISNLGFTSIAAPTGFKEVPAVVTLEAGWYAIAMMTNTNNIGFITSISGLTNLLGLLTPSSGTTLNGFRSTLAYGFFPSTALLTSIENSSTPLYWLKTA